MILMMNTTTICKKKIGTVKTACRRTALSTTYDTDGDTHHYIKAKTDYKLS